MNIIIKNHLTKTEVYDVYWKFATERQNVFYNRLIGKNAPWTNDIVISKYKFTNTYRAIDRVSQYLIANIINRDTKNNIPDEDRLFRIILFKIFNKIETWKLIEDSIGNICWSKYSFEKYDKILSSAFRNKKTIYSAAYIMASGKGIFFHERKHQNHLILLELMMKDDITMKVTSAPSMAKLYEILMSYPLIGPFLAYQYAIDINYSSLTDFSENDFVVAGPGARDGITKCFSGRCGVSDEDIIRLMCEKQDEEFDRLGLDFKSLFGRPLQLIDCQNLFCEVGKYARVSHPHVTDNSGRVKIKQIYRSSGAIETPAFPPKWGLSERVQSYLDSHLVTS